jgi:hypothetical protein
MSAVVTDGWPFEHSTQPLVSMSADTLRHSPLCTDIPGRTLPYSPIEYVCMKYDIITFNTSLSFLFM